MRRREFELALAGLASLPFGVVAAEQRGKLPKVAILSPGIPGDIAESGHPLHALHARLTELGYVDGQSVEYEFRFAQHAIERLPAMAAELVAGQPDAIYTWSTGGARAAAGATSMIPIVVAPAAEETMAALVPDFAHPSGNVTGLTFNSRQQQEKCLQLLKEMAPSVTRVGVLLNPLNPLWQNYPDVLADAARSLDVVLIRIEAHGPVDVEQAITAAAASQGIDGLFALGDTTLAASEEGVRRIVAAVRKLRLPAVSDDTAFTPGGGLLSLGSDGSAIGRGAAEDVHRILQGAKVAELPVVHPSKFILAVNLKAAREIGITIPPAILLRADEVIE